MSPDSHDSMTREQFSALFDGELPGDAARFALKRLSRDADARTAFGSWQMAGDVLRGTASAGAPADFADRIQQALTHEVASAHAGRDIGETPRRRWVGGAALAASVALAALFVARPFDSPSVPAPRIAERTPAPAASDPAPGMRELETSREPAEALASVAGKASTPRRVARAVSSPAPRPGTGTGAATRSNTLATQGARTEPVIASATVAEAPLLDAGTDPFRRLPAVIASKPWPRATLADFRGGSTLTTSYGDRGESLRTRAPAPSFYPFEPRLPAVQGSVDPAGAQQP